jgi:hypothetical protein
MLGITIGNWTVSSERESFRIFPKSKDGTTRPITRVNQFINFTCLRSGSTITFKRYLHQKNWYWRDSRDTKPCDEGAVHREMARMLGLTVPQAQELALACIMG